MNYRSPLARILTILTALCSILKAEEDILYLHCFSPTYGQAIQWEDSPKVKDPTPPAQLITLKVAIGRDFEAILNRQSGVSGRVSNVDGSMVVDLKGSFGSGFSFSGNVELDSIFETRSTWFSGVVYTTLCVLSKDKEIGRFLKVRAAADSERLKQATEQSKRNVAEARKKEAEQDGRGQPATSPESE